MLNEDELPRPKTRPRPKPKSQNQGRGQLLKADAKTEIKGKTMKVTTKT